MLEHVQSDAAGLVEQTGASHRTDHAMRGGDAARKTLAVVSGVSVAFSQHGRLSAKEGPPAAAARPVVSYFSTDHRAREAAGAPGVAPARRLRRQQRTRTLVSGRKVSPMQNYDQMAETAAK